MQDINGDEFIEIEGITYSSDGNFIVSSGQRKTGLIYILTDTGLDIITITSQYPNIKTLKVSPSDLTLVTGHRKGIQFWQFNNYTLIETVEAHNGDVISIVFSNDGKRMLSADDTGLVVQWETKLASLAYTPVSEISVSDFKSFQKVKKNFNNYENDINWLNFIETLLNRHITG
jgi:WD40 repeat protein